MYISTNKKMLFKRALQYFYISIFLVVFNLIYGLFAHGVSSSYMQLAFLFPLLGGSVVSLLMIYLPLESKIVSNIWRMGLTTLIVGSLLHGVFDIYGTEVGLVKVFFIFGIILLLCSLTLYVVSIVKAKR